MWSRTCRKKDGNNERTDNFHKQYSSNLIGETKFLGIPFQACESSQISPNRKLQKNAVKSGSEFENYQCELSLAIVCCLSFSVSFFLSHEEQQKTYYKKKPQQLLYGLFTYIVAFFPKGMISHSCTPKEEDSVVAINQFSVTANLAAFYDTLFSKMHRKSTFI